MAAGHNWHDEVYFGIHYDLHAHRDDTELGKELTAEHLYERLARVQPDWVQCDCKGHAGYTSWPTRVGSTSPGVIVDQLAIYREVTRRLGIKLGMHYSGVWDSRAVELHPEWARVRPDGTRDDRITCVLGPYVDELVIPQMIELIDTYGVDGFWVDGENWAVQPCWCERCRAEYRRRGGGDAPLGPDDVGWHDWLGFHRRLFVEYVAHYAEAVHTRKPDCLICSNWMYTIRQPDPVVAPVDYLSGDYTPVWGADRAALEGRFLDTRGRSWDLMAWGFTAQAIAPPVMKPAGHLCQEVAEVIALGGAVMIYGKPQRTGWLVGWHQDILADVAAFCRARQPLCHRTRTASEVAVLHLAASYYRRNQPLFNYGQAVEPVEGALHALLENHLSTDILDESAALARLSDYRLVVVPEQDGLSEAIRAALSAFAEEGGQVLMSGAHLCNEEPELVGVRATGVPLARATGMWGDAILPVEDRGVPVFGEWPGVTAAEGTAVWLHQMRDQEPEKDLTERPAVTYRPLGRGGITAIHGPLFANYAKNHYPDLRRLVREWVDRLAIPFTVTVDGPPWLEVVLRRREDRLLVNLLNRGAGETTNPHRVIVDELPAVTGVTVRVRWPEPTSARLLPSGAICATRYADGVLTVKVPAVPIHEVLVVA